MILTLVPEVSTDRQDNSALEPASPRLIVDVAVSRRKGRCALGSGERGTPAQKAVHNRFSCLRCRALRPTIRRKFGESKRGPTHVNRMTARGFCCVFRRERYTDQQLAIFLTSKRWARNGARRLRWRGSGRIWWRSCEGRIALVQ